MTDINGLAAFICVVLTGIIVAQCFSMSVKMTATAKPGLRALVGLASFGSLVVTSLILGGATTRYGIAIGGLAAVAVLFWVILRKWTRGMPMKYDTSPSPLQTES